MGDRPLTARSSVVNPFTSPPTWSPRAVGSDGVSTGFSDEVKMRIFDGVDQLSHDGGERHFAGLTGSDESLVK